MVGCVGFQSQLVFFSSKVSGKLCLSNCVGFVGDVQFWLCQVFKVSVISLVKVWVNFASLFRQVSLFGKGHG